MRWDSTAVCVFAAFCMILVLFIEFASFFGGAYDLGLAVVS
jgi:hypothetical protein